METQLCTRCGRDERPRQGEGRPMVTEEILEFLGNVPPFQFLDDDALKKVVERLSVEFFPKGAEILVQGGPPSRYLTVIRKGGVKVFLRSNDGEEIGIDYRNEGESFGYLSLLSGDRSRTNVVATEDTIAYQVDRETILGLIESVPAFTEYFETSFLGRIMDRTFAEARAGGQQLEGGERLLFTTTVGDLVGRGAVTAPDSVSVREAAVTMAAENISSLILVDRDGVPSGIVTDRDLRERVVAQGRSFLEPVAAVMNRSLVKVDAGTLCFEALVKMINGGIHHLVVVEDGGLKGVITNHDLMLLQGNSPLSLARDIEAQQTIEGIVPAARKINDVFSLLLKEGAKASNITRVVTEINDRLVIKIVEIAERTLGRPPLPYCWITFGSEGRKEQTFKTDQDNALIYADPATPEQAAAATEYFGRFAAFVNDGLMRCGFPECPGNYMARNPEWCQPLAVWKRYFSRWIATPTEEAILRSVILFDFRPMAGTLALGETLRAHLMTQVADQGIFLKKLSDLTVSVRPPVGFFRNLVVLKSGEHKDQLDLKKKCITPLINIARLYALEAAIPETSTLGRIAALRARHPVMRQFADDLEQAFEFFLLLRIHHQLGQIKAGEAPDNFIKPKALTNLQKRVFRDSCQAIAAVLDAITRHYNPGVI